MMKYAVRAEGLTVRRGGHPVLHDLDLGVLSGVVTGLLGPSGSGKTTLLRAVVGAQASVTGSVTVLGLPAGSPSLRHAIGYVTQAPSVYDDLTVHENLRFFARVLGVGRARVAACLDQVGLAAEAGRVVARLSGGQRARVSLAVALLGEPELLVLDEPTVGLDPVLRQELWAGFRELAAAGTTVLVSSHVMDEAERCDRLLLLRDGRLLDDGTPSELLRRTGATDVEGAFLRLVGARS